MAYNITINPSSLQLHVGDIDYISATLVPSTDLYTIAFESLDNDIVSVSSYGVVEANGIGNVTVRAYLEEDDTVYDTITVSVSQPEVSPVIIPDFITPKTNWTEKDKFNKEDYNRIKNNLNCLQFLYSELKRGYEKTDLGEDINDYVSKYKASSFNAFEQTLETLNIYRLDIGAMQTYFSNGIFIDYEELNRIESACSKLYELMINQYKGRRTLPAMLGLSSRDNFLNL